jgi:F-type H+-transporting ATPase subunit delta
MPTDRTLARKASEVYAEVLLAAAKASDKVLEVSDQLGIVLSTVIGSIELRSALTEKQLPSDVRQNIIDDIFSGFDRALLAWLGEVAGRGDLALLPRINEAYLYAAEKILHAVIIDVTTVVSLDAELRAKLKEKYSAQFGVEVILREHIDPAIIGGIVMTTHGRRIDASVISQLQNARAVLAAR